MAKTSDNAMHHQIRKVFDKVQESSAAIPSCVEILKAIFENNVFDDFIMCMKDVLRIVLQLEVKPLNLCHERLVDLFSSFFVSMTSASEDDNPLLVTVLNYLLKTQSACNETVRYRSCQMMNKIMNGMVGFDLSEELCEEIIDELLERLNDPKASVRVECIKVLYHLQDVEDPNDEIINNFIVNMTNDLSVEVRALVVAKISVRKDVIPHLIKRTRDVSEEVRLAALSRLSKVVAMLKISERFAVLNNGFEDTSERVRDYVSDHLLSDWLLHYESNCLQLLKAIRTDSNINFEKFVELSGKVVMALLKSQPLPEIIEALGLDKGFFKFENLNFESVICWRHLVGFLRQKEQYEELLNQILLELVDFCKYVRDYCGFISEKGELPEADYVENQFILTQMFTVTQGYELSDQFMHESLTSLVSWFLQNEMGESHVISTVVKNLEVSIPKVQLRVKFVCELISEIVCPISVNEEHEKQCREREFELSRLKTKFHTLSSELEAAVKEEKFLDAAELNKQIEEVKASLASLQTIVPENAKINKTDELPTIIKCLDIAVTLLQSPEVTSLSADLESLKENFFQEYLMHPNMIVQCKALKCFVCFCIIDRKTAVYGVHICCTPILAYNSGKEYDVSILKASIFGVVDLLLIYGPNIMAVPEKTEAEEEPTDRESTSEEHVSLFMGGTSQTLLIKALLDLMQNDVPEIQECAGEGLCKLVSHRCISSSLVTSHLIIHWSSPVTSDYLRQYIGFTLQNLPKHPETIDVMEKAVIPTLKTLLNAPNQSPLAEVDVQDVGKFMVSLCSCYSEGKQAHSNLAIKFLREIQNEMKGVHVLTYSKMLLFLEVKEDPLFVQELLELCETVKQENFERIIENTINKFIAKLTKLLPTNNKREIKLEENEEKTLQENEEEVCNS